MSAFNKMLRLMKYPDEWVLADTYLWYDRGGHDLSIWIRNGFWYYRFMNPVEISMSFIEKVRFHIAYLKLRRKLMEKVLSGIFGGISDDME